MSCVLVYSYEVCYLHIVTVVSTLVNLAETESQWDSDFMMKEKKLSHLCYTFSSVTSSTLTSLYQNLKFMPFPLA